MLVCLLLMLRLEGVEGNEIRGGNWLGGQRGDWVLGCVLGLVDHTHPTTAELLCDLVVGDGLADHGVGTRRLSSSNQWNGVEWVWRGYIFGYKTLILTIEAGAGFS